MLIDALEAELRRLDAEGRQPKLIYTIPSFQNPAGVSLDLERRTALVEIAARRRILIVEDDPYSRLRFEGEALPSLAELDADRGGVIHVGTFSKILAPGLRIGFAVAPAAIVAKLNLAKQGIDLCSSPLAQLLAARFVEGPRFEPYLATMVDLYRERRDVMVAALREHLPADTAFSTPAGGLFVWVTVPGLSSTALLPRALQADVAFVPGTAAYTDGRGDEAMRLNFSAVTSERIEEGVRRLGRVVAEQRTLEQSLRSPGRSWQTSAS